MTKEQYLFVSYARADQERVLHLVEAARKELEFRASQFECGWISPTSNPAKTGFGLF
jgi:hypothetical protein